MSSYTELALRFLKLATSGQIDDAYTLVHPDFRHHNAYYPGDAKSLANGMKDSFKAFPHKIFEVKHTVEQADLVAVHSRFQLSAEAGEMAIFHLFKFKDGQIVELWDFGQATPEDSPNENGMF